MYSDDTFEGANLHLLSDTKEIHLTIRKRARKHHVRGLAAVSLEAKMHHPVAIPFIVRARHTAFKLRAVVSGVGVVAVLPGFAIKLFHIIGIQLQLDDLLHGKRRPVSGVRGDLNAIDCNVQIDRLFGSLHIAPRLQHVLQACAAGDGRHDEPWAQ